MVATMIQVTGAGFVTEASDANSTVWKNSKRENSPCRGSTHKNYDDQKDYISLFNSIRRQGVGIAGVGKAARSGET